MRLKTVKKFKINFEQKVRPSNIICIYHPYYFGDDSPTLTCKNCCHLFVMAMSVKIQEKG